MPDVDLVILLLSRFLHAKNKTNELLRTISILFDLLWEIFVLISSSVSTRTRQVDLVFFDETPIRTYSASESPVLVASSLFVPAASFSTSQQAVFDPFSKAARERGLQSAHAMANDNRLKLLSLRLAERLQRGEKLIKESMRTLQTDAAKKPETTDRRRRPRSRKVSEETVFERLHSNSFRRREADLSKRM